VLARVLRELGLVPPVAPPAPRAEVVGEAASVGLSGSRALSALPERLAEISLSGEVLTARLPRAERVDLLRSLAKKLARDGRLSLALSIAEGVPPWGRLVLDVPRAALPALGLPPPGTRFDEAGARHVYHASTELEVEAWEGGLALRSHTEGRMVLALAGPDDEPPPRADAEGDAALVLALVRAERLRRRSPREAFEAARRRGREEPRRDAASRRRLHARLGWLDGFVPPGPNCLRRALAETMLDGGAATEKVMLSLSVGSTGHAHFPSDPQGPPRSYDVTFEV